MKKVFIMFLFLPVVLFSESKHFDYYDPPNLEIYSSNCRDPYDDRQIVDFNWYNSAIFKIEYFDVSYKNSTAKIFVRGREYDGKVNIIQNNIYFVPDDIIAIGEHVVDAIQFTFYGNCFKYYLDLHPLTVICAKEDMSYDVQLKLDFIEYDLFYAANFFEYEGIYRID